MKRKRVLLTIANIEVYVHLTDTRLIETLGILFELQISFFFFSSTTSFSSLFSTFFSMLCALCPVIFDSFISGADDVIGVAVVVVVALFAAA